MPITRDCRVEVRQTLRMKPSSGYTNTTFDEDVETLVSDESYQAMLKAAEKSRFSHDVEHHITDDMNLYGS